MATTLKAQLVFTAIPAGGMSTQPHGLNVQDLTVIPDHVHFDNSNFNFVSATTTTITIKNNGLAAGTCRVLVESWHSIERAFGYPITSYINQFPNPPFVSSGTSGGSGTTAGQAFTYTCTGAEGSDFFIPLPVAEPSSNYIPTVSCGGAAVIIDFDCPDLAPTDRTIVHFRIVTTTEVTTNDRLDVLINPRTA